MVEPAAKAVEAVVGDVVVFDVPDPDSWTLTSSEPTVFASTDGGTRDGVTVNPGGVALAAGKATVTFSRSDGGRRTVEVTVRGGALQALPPVMVSEGESAVTVRPGEVVVFTVDEPTAWTLDSGDPTVFAVTQGSDDGTVVMNPGGVALQKGVARVTFTREGGTTRTVDVTVAPS